MQGNESQLVFLKEILLKFTMSSGLKVNFHKSCLVPINIDHEKANSLASTFGCTVGSFPFTYLGLPMGLTKPQVKDYAPLICRIERRMPASSQFLSQASRLQLVNLVISSLPTYYMCSLKLPVTVIEIIDKYKKNCLWRRREFKNKGYNLAAWDLVRRPKSKGGLGVINLSLQNDALLLKQLDKFYRKENVQWVNLIWNRYYSDSVPHLARGKDRFGGRTFSGYKSNSEELLFVFLVGGTQSVFGRILLMEKFILMFTLDSLSMPRTPKSLLENYKAQVT